MAARGAVPQTFGPSRNIVSDYVRYRVLRVNPHWPGPGGVDAMNGVAEDEVDGAQSVLPADRQPELEDTIQRLSKEFEERYEQVFNEACGQIFITPSNAQTQFVAAVHTLFADGTNWGRIIALFAFSGAVAAQCVQKEMPRLVDHVVSWTAQYIDLNLASWIAEHGGWNGLIEFYQNGPNRNGTSSWDSWPSFSTLCRAFGTIGVLTIGALLAQK